MWQIPPHRLARSAHATSPPLAQGRGTTGIDIAATADVGGLQKRKCGPPLPPSQVGGGGETKSRPSEGERPVTAICDFPARKAGIDMDDAPVATSPVGSAPPRAPSTAAGLERRRNLT